MPMEEEEKKGGRGGEGDHTEEGRICGHTTDMSEDTIRHAKAERR